MVSNEIEDPWCKALHDCTACLREQKAEDADRCLAYLIVLEGQLEKEGIFVGESSNSNSNNEENYENDKVPTNYPLGWTQFCAMCETPLDVETAMLRGLATPPKPIHNKNFRPNMTGPRLRTRIFTSQSELFATKATHTAKTLGNWAEASRAYEKAILTIHKALDVTDTCISRWWNRWEQGLELLRSEQNLLERDASIVVVALESLVLRRDKLLGEARREESHLLRKLQPHWESRDAIKERLGTDRWKNNPNPKYDYAKQRADLEADLQNVRGAVTSLEEHDPKQALQKASGLQEGLRTNQKHGGGWEDSGDFGGETNNQNNSEELLLRVKHRYNNQRPSPEWMAMRVSLQDYPDPVDFGWTFTGSWEAVEFFERMVQPSEHPIQQNNKNSNVPKKPKLVKLDWYFTTATVKTSLEHPIQGKTQLFAKKCTPTLYAKVLTNPRTHTGKRYHRKPKHTHPNNNRQPRPHQELPHHHSQQQQQQQQVSSHYY